MAKVNKIPKEFKLSYIVNGDFICFIGDKELFRNTRSISGMHVRKSLRVGDYVCIPASRENFMIVEALGNPVSATERYIKRRLEMMTSDYIALTEWCELMSEMNVIQRPLMPHQDNFCALAINKHGILNASEQGTGKTAMAIALWAAWKPLRGLIVCPKSLIWQWPGEFYNVLGEHAPDLLPLSEPGMTIADKKDLITHISADAQYSNTIIIINYEIIDDLQKVITEHWKPDYVVFDEAWKIKSPKALSTKAAINIASAVPAHGHIQLLSGTPIGNDVGDLWSQMCMIESNSEYMEQYDEWMSSYATFKPIQTKSGRMINVPVGCKDPVGLMRRIAPHFFRASKATCLSLPDKVFDVIKFDLPPRVRALYDRVEEIGNEVFDPLSLSGERVTKLRLQQITGGNVPEIKDTYSVLKGSMIIESPKRDWVMDFARDVLKHEPYTRAIIWCKFNAEIETMRGMLAEILSAKAVIAVTRHTHDRDLQEAKEAFNARQEGVAQVLVAQIKKLAYGHNLQAGDWNILYSHPWSYIDRDQLEDRTHRLGREGIVRYVELVINGTHYKNKAGENRYKQSIDEDVLDAIHRKENLAERFGPDTVGEI